jgi:hypothetical protein
MVTKRVMVRAAGVVLLILSGCAVPEYFSVSYWQRDSSGQTTGIGVTRTGGSTAQIVVGNPDVVAQRFKNALARLGMQVQMVNDMESIRISSTTQGGKQLTIVLKLDTTTGGEHTQFQMEWTGGADTQVESDLVRLVVGVGR